MDLASRPGDWLRHRRRGTAAILETTLVVDARRRAIVTPLVRRGLIHQQLLAAHGIRPMMSRVGDGWDNAPVGKVFTQMKRSARYGGSCSPFPARTRHNRGHRATEHREVKVWL